MGRSVPIAPGSGVAGKTLSSNVSEGLKCPGMGLRVERRVVCEVEQLRHRGQALLRGQHAGLGQAARSPLAHHQSDLRELKTFGENQSLDFFGDRSNLSFPVAAFEELDGSARIWRADRGHPASS